MRETILGTAIGVVIGGLITWFVAWIYYKKAGAELLRESERLTRLHDIALNALEDAGLIRLNRDNKLRPIGRAIHARDIDREHGTVLGAGDVIVDTMEEAVSEGRAIPNRDTQASRE
ncbi:MAG: hypothetical protein AABM67_00900 [Acidobacteriota bacterium]